jgi:hypothetical protein
LRKLRPAGHTGLAMLTRQRLRKLQPAGQAGLALEGKKGRRGYTSPLRDAARSTRRLHRFERVLQALGFNGVPEKPDSFRMRRNPGAIRSPPAKVG